MLSVVLTDHEKMAGRHYREMKNEELARKNEEAPPTYTVMTHWAQYRHLCSARRNISTAMELKEVYVTSPEYVICENTFGDVFSVPSSALIPPDSRRIDTVSSGLFAFYYKEGRCRGCGQTGRSKLGVCKPSAMRPPLEGRVARSG